VRLERLQPGSVLKASEGVLFIRATDTLVEDLIEFIENMWAP
jgi:predicted ATP-dependent protease